MDLLDLDLTPLYVHISSCLSLDLNLSRRTNHLSCFPLHPIVGFSSPPPLIISLVFFASYSMAVFHLPSTAVTDSLLLHSSHFSTDFYDSLWTWLMLNRNLPLPNPWSKSSSPFISTCFVAIWVKYYRMFHDAKALVMPRLSCNGAKFGFHTKLQLLEISFVCANVGCFGSSKLQTISISTGLSNFNLSRFFFLLFPLTGLVWGQWFMTLK